MEDFGPAGIDRFGSRVVRVYRYRLTSRDRIICYTFEVQTDGKVARMFPEEE